MKKRQLSGTHWESEACYFCTAEGHLVALAPPPFLLPWPAGALSAPPLAVGLPGNGGLERSVQGLSDSGCRLADDLLAGLESSEPRQLKWSLKLEPTFREGGKETGGREGRKWEGGRRESLQAAPPWRHTGRLWK